MLVCLLRLLGIVRLLLHVRWHMRRLAIEDGRLLLLRAVGEAGLLRQGKGALWSIPMHRRGCVRGGAAIAARAHSYSCHVRELVVANALALAAWGSECDAVLAGTGHSRTAVHDEDRSTSVYACVLDLLQTCSSSAVVLPVQRA